MDQTILHFFNQTLANPFLDGVMVAATWIGLSLLPLMGLLFWLRGKRQIGQTLLLAQLAALLANFIFYYLALRPRPLDVRLLLPTPEYPSFPSGHSAIAFATASVLILCYRQSWQRLLCFALALLIALSRLYLGHHYPTDVLGGGVMGATIGAACYGLLLTEEPMRLRIRWLLWPQIAVAILVTEMAYLGLSPLALLRWPLADKSLHFLLFGAVTFWLNLWTQRQRYKIASWSLPIAILLPFSLAFGEEIAQSFSAQRTSDLGDLSADIVGMVCFWWLSEKLKVES